MKTEIQSNLNNPSVLEKLYRSNKPQFKKDFNSIYPSVQGDVIAEAWHERLNFENEETNWGSKFELSFILIAGLIAGSIAKIPSWFPISEDFFYPRNMGFIFLPLIAAYFAWKNKLSDKRVLLLALVTLASLTYINLLPENNESDTFILACIHLPLVLWVVMGSAFVGEKLGDLGRRLDFLKFNGDLIVMTTLILIAGGILSGLTIGLFSLIGIEIIEWYMGNVGVYGLASAPIIGTFLTQTNPQLVGKVSPVIARIFSPLVLVMLVIYLIAIISSGKNPYNDREFLMIFNAMLIGVMAIIFFALAEGSNTSKTKTEVWVLFLLSSVTILVNGIALSAIVFRIIEMGITPNRLAIFGANILILSNLLLIATKLYKVISNKADINTVGNTIARYIPVYFVWLVIVTLLFPVLFGFA